MGLDKSRKRTISADVPYDKSAKIVSLSQLLEPLPSKEKVPPDDEGDNPCSCRISSSTSGFSLDAQGQTDPLRLRSSCHLRRSLRKRRDSQAAWMKLVLSLSVLCGLFSTAFMVFRVKSTSYDKDEAWLKSIASDLFAYQPRKQGSDRVLHSWPHHLHDDNYATEARVEESLWDPEPNFVAPRHPTSLQQANYFSQEGDKNLRPRTERAAEANASLRAALEMSKAGKMTKAMRLFQHALALLNDDPELLIAYGEFLEKYENNFIQADHYYSKALTLSPRNSRALENKLRTSPIVADLDFRTLTRIDEKRDELAKIPDSNAALRRIKKEAYFQYVYHTVGIEGNTMTLSQTRSVLETRMAIGGKSLMEHNEILGMDAALRFVNQSLLHRIGTITVGDIFQIHRKVMGMVDPDIAGVYRKTQVYVSRHVPPTSDRLPSLMDDLVEWLNSPSALEAHPLQYAALAHYKLVYIHPFVDGNGRTARLFMNWILMQEGYPPVIIRKQDRHKYYETLQLANDGDVRPFLRFVADCADKTLDVYLWATRHAFSSGRTTKSASAPAETIDGFSKHHRNSFRKLFSKVVKTREETSGEKRSASCKFRPPQMNEDQLRTYLFGNKTPGAVGLTNHGNTCFINAVVQCLSHTDRLAEYLALNHFKYDLQMKRKKVGIIMRRGTGGELTEKLATVIRALWSGQYSSSVSADFKAVVEKYGTLYRGGTQHDAQEFLLWLLDKVHEDLNIAKKRRYKHLKGTCAKADEVLAAESLHNFLRCNESFVHGLFQAQFRSSLTCPHCRCQSNTFDPFLCLSLPIPQAARRPVFVSVVFLSQQPRQVKLGFSMDCDATIGELRETIATDTGININRCVLAEIDGEGFRRTFSGIFPYHQSLRAIDVDDRVHGLYALELPEARNSSEEEGEIISIVLVNVLRSSESGEVGDEHFEQCTRFGSPHVTQLRREMSYEDFQKLLLKEMQSMVQPSILTSKQEMPLFSVEVYSGEKNGEVIDPTLNYPLYAEAVDQALSLSDPDGDGQYGPKHIKLILKWDRAVKEKVIFDDQEHMDDHESVRALLDNPQFQPPVTLEECFREYTSEEILGTENAWLCPSCNKRGKGIKRIALWSLPEILIIHLKRFKQWSTNGIATGKLTTLVDFPKNNFDVSAHLATASEKKPGLESPDDDIRRAGSSSGMFKRVLRRVRGVKPAPKAGTSSASASLSKGKRRPRPEDCSYELYAVCNHHGLDDQGGHYTAYCKNSTDDKWYCFDDTKVSVIDRNEIVTEDAYVLFYRRKDPGSGCAMLDGSSTMPMSTSKNPLGSSGTLPMRHFPKRHWVYDIPGLRPVNASGSRISGGEEDSGVGVSRCSSDGLTDTERESLRAGKVPFENLRSE
ncbi:unnamed protein product [Notodromas monacha]|uniref:Protein adenylyltransferase Fic n=1 Tax=Notodromas monacha TaxID=399045 RepID=A0A7R9GE89_9CRUS|nr:unnamed protein product [Notodromas monacha]CAG0917794.1 unnamed protein product [Notodromas monacha]